MLFSRLAVTNVADKTGPRLEIAKTCSAVDILKSDLKEHNNIILYHFIGDKVRQAESFVPNPVRRFA